VRSGRWPAASSGAPRHSACAGRLGTARGRRLPALHAQRDHRRRRVSRCARGRRASGGGHVLDAAVAPICRRSLRCDLCRCAEEHRSRGPDAPGIVRRALYGRALDICPAMLNWQALDGAGSMLNTPPTFAIYLAGLVFAWLEEQGGLEAMGARNRAKAETLYAAIDGSDFYANPCAPLLPLVDERAVHAGRPGTRLHSLSRRRPGGCSISSGHRSVGGMRASLYNAMLAVRRGCADRRSCRNSSAQA
jgi:hypothetical protein